MTETRTIVTVHKAGLTINDTITYDATDFIVTECGALILVDSDRPNASGGSGIGPFRRVAAWAPGTWARAEVTEAPAAPAEPEEPDAGPGTFEVYEDNRGKYRYRLKAHNGEVIASGQAYASRKNARAGAAAVQRAANGAPIVDVDGEGQ